MSNENTSADSTASERSSESAPAESESRSETTASDEEPCGTQASPEMEYSLEDVLAQVEVLQEENRRLRADYVRAKQTEYRHAALTLVLFSLVAGGGALLFQDVRATLFGLAGIGMVTAILIYYLMPHHVATATVGERTYATLAQVGEAISADLGLQETRIYVPLTGDDDVPGDTVGARLFIPLHTSYTIPEPAALSSVFVVQTDTQTRGVSLPPTGGFLVQECRETMVDELASTPEPLCDQLTDALVAGFELADDAVADVDSAEGKATLGVRNSTFGAINRFDHPLPSFVAVGLAVGLQTPVERAAITTNKQGEFDTTVTYTWDSESVDEQTATDTPMADEPHQRP